MMKIFDDVVHKIVQTIVGLYEDAAQTTADTPKVRFSVGTPTIQHSPLAKLT